MADGAWHGAAWLGEARLGRVWLLGLVRHGRHGKAGPGGARRGRQGRAWLGVARQGRQGLAWHVQYVENRARINQVSADRICLRRSGKVTGRSGFAWLNGGPDIY